METKKKVVADIEPVTTFSTQKIPVNQFGLDGKFIKTFESISKASNTLNINYASICLCLKGKTKTAGKFQWRKVN